MTTSEQWSTSDDEFIVATLYDDPQIAINHLAPRHSEKAVLKRRKDKLDHFAQIVADSRREWTNEELELLADDTLSVKVVAKMIKRSVGATYKKRSIMRSRRRG